MCCIHVIIVNCTPLSTLPFNTTLKVLFHLQNDTAQYAILSYVAFSGVVVDSGVLGLESF